ncbi:hypothetical protein ebA5813 [Aromatoleum aromaticum EbN1]|uniref:Uncharacterized protein n=1 Tax=Aromatoleum aromaticum (strain DSM 19018 / LMG 30748 / EbN1) TaxID=76114 RepID=Q5NZU0_AROAE|nr:hypothetical protein ebA5813 [Aromatoleum aromaticum EbN1]
MIATTVPAGENSVRQGVSELKVPEGSKRAALGKRSLLSHL